jgi:hypothetical protein
VLTTAGNVARHFLAIRMQSWKNGEEEKHLSGSLDINLIQFASAGIAWVFNRT